MTPRTFALWGARPGMIQVGSAEDRRAQRRLRLEVIGVRFNAAVARMREQALALGEALARGIREEGR